MNYIQKSNALVRLSIYIGLVTSILSKNYIYLYIPIGIMSFTYIMFLLRKVDNKSNNNINNILNTTNQSGLKNDNVMKSHLNITSDVNNLNSNNKEEFGDTYNESLNKRNKHHSIEHNIITN